MPRFDRNGDGNGGPPKRETSVALTEPRCKVCTHPHRHAIDKLLAIKRPYAEIERIFSNDDDKLDRRSISTHDKKHLSYDDAAVRQLIEHEAEQANENLKEGIRGNLQRRLTLDVAIQKGFDGLIRDDIEVELRDLVKVIEVRERMDAQVTGAAVEELQVQFNAFRQAVQEIVPSDQWVKLLDRTKDIIRQPDAPALKPPS